MTRPTHLSTHTGMPTTLGRFELRRLLGRGAQAGVWLAHDPRLQRDVALKLLHVHSSDGQAPVDATHPWLQEARSLGRLVHPHIVTLYEADVFDGRPGLVLEYVNGPTLAQRLQQHGPLPALEAAALVADVLDALQHAHDSGVVHRDLKPSNLLWTPGNQVKVTDFGIATRLRSAAAGASAAPAGLEGTPGYLAPETARGEPPHPSNDVFAAGLVLAELLLGQPLLAEPDPYRAVYRVAHEDLALPHHPKHPVDPGLRAVVQRALARDPAQRYRSAADMALALRNWLTATQSQSGGGGPASHAETGHATLEFLLRRMRRTSDFPAMSQQILRVQRLASSETENLNSLTNEILKDVALTNKLLRLVNSAHYQHVGGGHINTVSRAVGLIGFAGIRNMAMSLVLLDHMDNKAHATQLKAEFLRALLAADLATALGPRTRDSEEVFIGALFQGLGRLLSEFYFPDEAQQVRATVATGKATEEQAATAVLGLGYQALGQGVGKAWGLPASMLKLMRHPETSPPLRPPTDATEHMHWLAVAGNELADVFLKPSVAEHPALLRQVAARLAPCLGCSAGHIEQVTQAAREQLALTADAIGLRVPDQSPAAALTARTPRAAAPPADSLSALSLTQSVPITAASGVAPNTTQVDAAAVLATGIQDITNALVDTEQFQLNDVLRMILETMLRAMGLRQALICLREGNTPWLTGRLGLGPEAAAATRRFKVGLQEPHNLFTVVCNKGLDTLIHDASTPSVHKSLPLWYRQHLNAATFVLLPLQLKGVCIGLLYADKSEPNSIALDDKSLALLKTLRNQALMALRQAKAN